MVSMDEKLERVIEELSNEAAKLMKDVIESIEPLQIEEFLDLDIDDRGNTAGKFRAVATSDRTDRPSGVYAFVDRPQGLAVELQR